MSARIAKSLDALRKQIDAAAPGRDKSSDGWLGDAAHAARKSDHNPNAAGVVTALDITHDPARGVNARALAEALITSRDKRIKYVISNRQINSSAVSPWQWRPYDGPNAHEHHVHVSVMDDPALYDDIGLWSIPGVLVPQPSSPMSQTSPDLRLRMARAILDYEARRDSQGHLAVYDLPPGDGGGAYEVAGINEKYHKAEADHLVALIRAGSFDEAEKYATDFMLRFTDVVLNWGSLDAGVEFYLRDCVFNRGPTGAAAILQIALGVAVDGIVGEKETKPALAKAPPAALLNALHPAREKYERSTYPWKKESRDESNDLWKGLVNRWNKVLEQARKFSLEAAQPTPQPIPIPAPEPIPKPEPIPQPLPLPEPVSPQPVSISDIEQISREIVRDLLRIRQIVGATLAALTGQQSTASPSVSAKLVPATAKEKPMSMSASNVSPPVAGDIVAVEVKPAWQSKIISTQGAMVASALLTYFFGRKFDFTPDQLLDFTTAMTTASGLLTSAFKTWWTKTVTPSSVAK